ncbi:hypothetical protein E3N88_23779 [Mikania micrantha]|uniref:Uncharacterized protein n=1 Tax=Mikania micrantha TaxID=192012 RepID=A0A5N6NGW7_9ASTR|nr:hypothetical protein E3N88_23779 [Mikania micrantha]
MRHQITTQDSSQEEGESVTPRNFQPELENLNSPKSIAVRDDRSSSTIAVRGVFREKNYYFNRRATRSYFLDSCRGTRRAYLRRNLYKTKINHSSSPCSIFLDWNTSRRPFSLCYTIIVPLEAIVKAIEARNRRLKAWKRSFELVIDATITCDAPGAVFRRISGCYTSVLVPSRPS